MKFSGILNKSPQYNFDSDSENKNIDYYSGSSDFYIPTWMAILNSSSEKDFDIIRNLPENG